MWRNIKCCGVSISFCVSRDAFELDATLCKNQNAG